MQTRAFILGLDLEVVVDDKRRFDDWFFSPILSQFFKNPNCNSCPIRHTKLFLVIELFFSIDNFDKQIMVRLMQRFYLLLTDIFVIFFFII